MNTENKQDESKEMSGEGSGRCLRCHRVLKSPESIRIGLGNVCLRKLGLKKIENGGQTGLPKAKKELYGQIDITNYHNDEGGSKHEQPDK